MRFLLVMPNYVLDPNTGAMHALRTMMKWLAQAGHDCRVLCTARFDTSNILDIPAHLQSQSIPCKVVPAPKRITKRDGMVRKESLGRSWLHFSLHSELTMPLRVELLQTIHNDAMQPDQTEGQQFLDRLQSMLDTPADRPDVLIAYGRHAIIPRALKLAHQHSIITVASLHNEGFEMPEYFVHAHHAFTCSPYLSNIYRLRLGIASTPLVPAMDWSQILAPEENRAMVTFVNPALVKGAGLVARLAAMLGEKRPDIPLMIVQSAGKADFFNSVPDIDFRKYPSIFAAPAVPQPKDYLALTKILLVPSTWHEPFGRVAAEAMINGIPPLVSPRGALPDVVGGDFAQGGGGLVLPLPHWLDRHCPAVVNEEEAKPWFDAVTRLWDDTDYYQRVSQRARTLAHELYSEEVQRQAYLNYFVNLKPTQGVLLDE